MVALPRRKIDGSDYIRSVRRGVLPLLIGLDDGDYSRPYEISVRRVNGSIEWLPAGQRAKVDVAAYVPGASGKAMLVTGAHTQELTDADDLTGAAWGTTLVTVSSSSETAPDGTTTAYDVAFDANGLARLTQDVPHGNLTDDADYTLSVWAKVASGSETFRFQAKDKSGSTVFISGDLTATTTWQRFDATFNAGSNASPVDVEVRLLNGSDGAAKTVTFWLPDLTKGAYPVPTIRGSTSATLVATEWTVATQPSQLLGGAFSWSWVPLFRSDEGLAAAVLWSFGNDTKNEVLWVKSDALKVREAGNNRITNTISFSRLSLLKSTADLPAGSLTVSGADTGSDTETGTSFTWPSGDTMKIGRRGSDAQLLHFNGLIIAIERA